MRLYLGAHDMATLGAIFPPSDNVVLVPYKTRSRVKRLFFEIPAIIRKHKIDYAHFQYVSPLWKNCRQIVTVHDVLFKDFPGEFPLSYRIEKSVLFTISALRADILTTVSAYSGKAIKKFLHTGDRPIHVVPNGINERFFEPYDEEASRIYIREKYGLENFILYVSRIEPRKNHLLVLKAWQELELYRQGIRLAFLGHRAIPVPELETALAALPDEQMAMVLINSNVNDEDLLEMYRAARIFVYPSRAEGFGIPPLEAAALQKPVLCSNTSAMKDFSFFGANHIDPDDIEGFKARMSAILKNEPSRVFLREVAAIIRRDYSWDGAARKLYELLPVSSAQDQ